MTDFKVINNENLDGIMLGIILIDVFENWVGTESESLLEDGGTVIDHLNNSDYGDIDFKDIPNDIWVKAWDIFDENLGRR